MHATNVGRAKNGATGEPVAARLAGPPRPLTPAPSDADPRMKMARASSASGASHQAPPRQRKLVSAAVAVCIGAQRAALAQDECRDINTSCGQFLSLGYTCDQALSGTTLLRDQCELSCGVCIAATPAPPPPAAASPPPPSSAAAAPGPMAPPCLDTMGSCGSLLAAGYACSFEPVPGTALRSFCPLSCGVCGGQGCPAANIDESVHQAIPTITIPTTTQMSLRGTERSLVVAVATGSAHRYPTSATASATTVLPPRTSTVLQASLMAATAATAAGRSACSSRWPSRRSATRSGGT